MNTKKLSSTIVAIFIFLAATSCGNNNEGGHARYVLTQTVFKDFQGTKELGNKVTKLQEKQKYILDSIQLEIKTLETTGVPERTLNSKKEVYNRLLSEFAANNQQQDQEYTQALWKQINQYVNEYGRKQGYDFIYGADGSGSIMYADSALDVTAEVLKYMNEKYAGK